MDYSKLLKAFEDDNFKYATNLTKKIATPPALNSHQYFCMWSDLLGFSKHFVDCNWNPNRADQKKIYDRLRIAHSKALYHSSSDERLMILNDGMAKVTALPDMHNCKSLLQISLYIRACVWMHIDICKSEKELGYPGCRSVLASGIGIEYLADEIRYDDYVYNYTKPEGSSISSQAQRNGNPIVIYNPLELQMNTAFSKAYIIEGNVKYLFLPKWSFIVDQSVVDSLIEYAKAKGYIPLIFDCDDYREILFPYSQDDPTKVLMGFRLSRPEQLMTSNLTTTIYKLLRFYPNDEKTTEFFFDLETDLNKL